ncbi:MAG TPA: OmpH family outer membrane protein [Chitinophaga sp.]|uniref:OmpH family outer membrane protein n=1 Tax=Chitinophaga sp. TaxID=1869181 RepID=UPI002DB7E6D8|nr:OmpH family outer membrane protein [Chitinophaga sp.]HEU4553059.1 OmpH family outer membrane protein [Chitinophaga sp.]
MRNVQQTVKNGCLIILVTGLFAACGQSGKTANNANNTAASTAANAGKAGDGGLRIAYVDLDSVEARYEYFKEKKAELEKRQQAIDNELKANVRALQNEAADFQRRANANQLTQSEGEAAQRSLMEKQQQLEAKRQNLSQQYMEQEAKFNEDLQKRLDNFLKTFNADKKYSFIFSYRAGASNILYKDEALDITAPVIEGLNKASDAKTNE